MWTGRRYAASRPLEFHAVGRDSSTWCHCPLGRGENVLSMWKMAPHVKAKSRANGFFQVKNKSSNLLLVTNNSLFIKSLLFTSFVCGSVIINAGRNGHLQASWREMRRNSTLNVMQPANESICWSNLAKMCRKAQMSRLFDAYLLQRCEPHNRPTRKE